MTPTSCSARAFEAAMDAQTSASTTTIEAAMAAAHDRERLGLEASARIGDTLAEVCEWLRCGYLSTGVRTELGDRIARHIESNYGLAERPPIAW
jgi:hypothetical protein